LPDPRGPPILKGPAWRPGSGTQIADARRAERLASDVPPRANLETKNQGNIVADGHAPFAMAAL
jgi:hypothetical protein